MLGVSGEHLHMEGFGCIGEHGLVLQASIVVGCIAKTLEPLDDPFSIRVNSACLSNALLRKTNKNNSFFIIF
jgi:hypothetical protein